MIAVAYTAYDTYTAMSNKCLWEYEENMWGHSTLYGEKSTTTLYRGNVRYEPMTRKTYTQFNNLEDQVDMNSRMYAHVVPSLDEVANRNMLEPSFDPRATPTRYTRLQTIPQRAVPLVAKEPHPAYDQSKVNGRIYSGGPFVGFADNVDTETVLRNQVVPLGRSDIHTFIPSTESDMYVTRQASLSNRLPGVNTRQFQGLFEETRFAPHDPNVLGGGGNVFSNHTREQRNE